MRRLAKGGFSQSYTYFTWRNTKRELTEYLTELTQTESAEYMRPNLFANTPDILHEYLQFGGRPAFMIRLVLAATLGATYGIYGPPFEQCVGTPGAAGLGRVPRLREVPGPPLGPRRARGACATTSPGSTRSAARTRPCTTTATSGSSTIDNDADPLLRQVDARTMTNLILVVVNLDPYHTQSGWVQLPRAELGLGSGPGESYQVHDLISDARYLWHGESNFVELDPFVSPAHIFRVRRKIRTEQDFDYFM